MPKTLRLERDGAIATLTLSRPPVNAIDGTLCQEVIHVLDELEADSSVHALILAGRAGVFSAGLDVRALYALERPQMVTFWGLFCDFFRRLAGTPLVTVAAIEGHAPAGGCVMALACDHRIMAEGDFRIGLNEVMVGLPVPFWLTDWAISLMGRRRAERLLQLGALLTPAEALMAGMIDEVVPPGAVLDACRTEIGIRFRSPPGARRLTKAAARGDRLATMMARAQQDTDVLIDSWFGDECRAVMGQLVDKLAGE